MINCTTDVSPYIIPGIPDEIIFIPAVTNISQIPIVEHAVMTHFDEFQGVSVSLNQVIFTKNKMMYVERKHFILAIAGYHCNQNKGAYRRDIITLNALASRYDLGCHGSVINAKNKVHDRITTERRYRHLYNKIVMQVNLEIELLKEMSQ